MLRQESHSTQNTQNTRSAPNSAQTGIAAPKVDPKLPSAGPGSPSMVLYRDALLQADAPPPQACGSRPMAAGPKSPRNPPKPLGNGSSSSACEERPADQLVSALPAVLKKESLTVCRPCAPASTTHARRHHRAAKDMHCAPNFLGSMLWDISIDSGSATCGPFQQSAAAEQKQKPTLKLRPSIQ